MFGILIASISFALAVEQDLEVTVGQNITLVISPGTVEFGIVAPGTTDNDADSGDITFDASGSNVDVTVAVTDVSGFPFESSTLFLDGDTPVGQSWFLECTIVNDICQYTTANTTPTLDVPVGAAQGNYVGILTYLITGSPPGPL